jgi:hypothetical protein
MSSKLLKAQFNKMHTGAILLEKDSVSIFAGNYRNNVIEITDKGISLQCGPGKNVMINSLSIKGPLHTQSSLPMDFLPGITNVSPRKTLDIPFLDAVPDLVGVMTLYGSIASAGGL